eukprot:TRINITY_DN3736_c0_g1_i1.p1 TRINITY_DN3736_c0_g1~~TRINITY_DN3736_c0_g1_i1.p1  ORF type:complete len:142 (-),score=9.95 TRINITY_DN3736_c0_g1_i1:448-873(-)
MMKRTFSPICFVEWSSPEHAVSCICKGHNYLFTGSFTGELCYWSEFNNLSKDGKKDVEVPNCNGQYEPRAMMMSNVMTAVTAMTRCYLESEEICLTSSYGGYLSIWSVKRLLHEKQARITFHSASSPCVSVPLHGLCDLFG